MAADSRGLPVSRRCFVQGAGVAGLGLLAGCGRLPGQAPAPPPKVPTIGYLDWGTPGASDSLESPGLEIGEFEAFRQGLAALGYVEGQTVVLEYRFADRTEVQLREAAADLVRLPVDVLVTSGIRATLAAQAATSPSPANPTPCTNGRRPTGPLASIDPPGSRHCRAGSLPCQR